MKKIKGLCAPGTRLNKFFYKIRIKIKQQNLLEGLWYYKNKYVLLQVHACFILFKDETTFPLFSSASASAFLLLLLLTCNQLFWVKVETTKLHHWISTNILLPILLKCQSEFFWHKLMITFYFKININL